MNELLLNLLQAILTVAVPVLSGFLVRTLNANAKAAAEKAQSETARRYLTEGAEAISTAVAYVSQTYVDALKKSGTFDLDNQKLALSRAKAVAMSIMTEESKHFLTEAYGTLNNYLTTKIESEVKLLKDFSVVSGSGVLVHGG